MVAPVSAPKGRVGKGSCEPLADRRACPRCRRDDHDRGLGAVPRRLVARLADPRSGEPGLPAARLALTGGGPLELRLAHARASLDAELLGVVVELVAGAPAAAPARALAAAPAG